MKRFISKLLIFSIPGWVLIILFFILDPFMIIYNYNNYYKQQKIPVYLNRDHVSTRTYIQNREIYHYNSFIFGNSRSLVYHVEDWEPLLSGNNSCYHFDASAETLYGIQKKINLIDQLGDSLKNVLLILDTSLLQLDQAFRYSHLFYPSPILENNKHIMEFYWVHFMAYCNPKIAYAIFDYTLSGEIKDYMIKNSLIKDLNITYLQKYNEIRYDSIENEIKKGNYYTLKQRSVFKNKQKPSVHPVVIKEKQFQILTDIANILHKHNSSYKVIISPLYNQQELQEEDKNKLSLLFGAENIFDFSGVNCITNDYHNYYEDSHYRPCVAQYILKTAYK